MAGKRRPHPFLRLKLKPLQQRNVRPIMSHSHHLTNQYHLVYGCITVLAGVTQPTGTGFQVTWSLSDRVTRRTMFSGTLYHHHYHHHPVIYSNQPYLHASTRAERVFREPNSITLHRSKHPPQSSDSRVNHSPPNPPSAPPAPAPTPAPAPSLAPLRTTIRTVPTVAAMAGAWVTTT